MEERTLPYFRYLWQTNVTDLEKQCDDWEKICMKESVPDEVHGEIRTNIGLAKLLINQKLKQFKGLIDDSEFNTGEKEITCLDLQGFWDMVYNEVVKIKTCFIRLEKCKNNKWEFDVVDSVKVQKKKIPVNRATAISKPKDDSSNSRALAARQRFLEAKKKFQALREEKKMQNFVEIVETSKTDFNHTKIEIPVNNVKFSDTTKAIDMAVTDESGESVKLDLRVNEKQLSRTKINDKVETVMSKESKFKGKSLTPSIQNKENINDSSAKSVKYNSKADTKSKEDIQAPSSKKRGQKSYGKLQCVTRSAKKALVQQNLSLES